MRGFVAGQLFGVFTVLVAWWAVEYGNKASIETKANADKRKACQVGWRHAVIHYEIYNLKPATEIEADAVLHCKDWVLN